jgi:hypothetical protein
MMTTTGADAAVAAYLERLKDALRELSLERRAEIVADIDDHIAGARAELPGGGDEAAVRNLLDRLGSPEQIAASAGVPEEPPAGRKSIVLEVVALILLNLGGLIVPVAGWFVGVALLWASSKWTRKEKLIGTFVPPGGLMGLVFAFYAGIVAYLDLAPSNCQVTPGPAVGDPPAEVTCGTGPAPLWQTLVFVALGIFFAVMPFVTTFYLARKLRRAA